jgi:uncharacterized protein
MRLEETVALLQGHQAELETFGVRSLAVFGSTARSEAGPTSDIDVLVEFVEPVGLFKFLDVKDYLESLLGCEVDLVTQDALKRQLRGEILQEAVHAF